MKKLTNAFTIFVQGDNGVTATLDFLLAIDRLVNENLD
jgi:hypothetical protein